MAHILLVHSDGAAAEPVAVHLRHEGHTVREADGAAATLGLGRTAADTDLVVIVARDASCDLLREVRATCPDLEVVVVSASPDVDGAVSAMKLGAADYVSMGGDVGRLSRAVRDAAARRRGQPAPVSRWLRDGDGDAVVVDAVTRAVFARGIQAATVDSTVLLSGESGTGKDVLARCIHRHSKRKSFKFVPVNCGSIPESLIETELFGYKKGAFTGAALNTRGLIDEADGGVLFLDEIGDMPWPMQVRLLRFLDSGEVRPVGDTGVRHVNVRVVAATNRMLEDEVREGRFRLDLFYRLSVVTLHLPALRERRDDILPLIDHHVKRIAARFGRPVPRVSPDALAALLAYRWPGNIRELQNVLEQAVIQASDGVITSAELSPAIALGTAPPSAVADATFAEHRRIMTALQRHKGNHREAAAALGISRTTLWRRLRPSSV